MENRRPLLEVVFILSLSMLILAGYAAIEEMADWEFKPKKTQMLDYFTRTEEPKLSNAILDFKPFQAVFKIDSSKIIDSTRQVILLTGDSMCEGQMFAWRKYAEFNHHELITSIWYSSSTMLWSKSDSLRKLIKKYKPTYIIFNLGSNELFIKDIKKERDPYIKNIVEQAENHKFVWIAPPNWKEDTGINELILKNAGKDRVFLSKKLQFQRASDGAHPTWSSAAMWTDSISVWIMKESRYKILLNKPI